MAAPSVASHLLIPVVAVAIFVTAVAIGRAIRWVYRWLAARLERRVGARAARASALVLLTCSTALVFSGLVLDALVSMADRSFALLDTKTTGGAVQPTSTLRSGGPGSLVTWESLGRQGRRFTGTGPTAEDIAAFTGSPAMEPIRAYAGYASAEDPEARAALAVDELERAGGFDRSYLLVVTTTGTGIVEPSSASAFEYLTEGDSAIVATQYSHLPSWLSYLVDREVAREAGRDLFDEVYGRWSQLPADDRPELWSSGRARDPSAARTRSAASVTWRTGRAVPCTSARRASTRCTATSSTIVTREARRSSRFTTTAGRSGSPAVPGRESHRRPAPGPDTHVLYMQHASDPITWWSPDLMLRASPTGWRSLPGRDVLDRDDVDPVRDLLAGVRRPGAVVLRTPPGHGHVYTGEHVDGWAAVLQPAGWTEEKARRLREIILKGG